MSIPYNITWYLFLDWLFGKIDCFLWEFSVVVVCMFWPWILYLQVLSKILTSINREPENITIADILKEIGTLAEQTK